jgi:hypothetical protein
VDEVDKRDVGVHEKTDLGAPKKSIKIADVQPDCNQVLKYNHFVAI